MGARALHTAAPMRKAWCLAAIFFAGCVAGAPTDDLASRSQPLNVALSASPRIVMPPGNGSGGVTRLTWFAPSPGGLYYAIDDGPQVLYGSVSGIGTTMI